MNVACDIALFVDTRHIRTKEEYSEQIKKLCECGFYNFNFDFWVGADYAPLRKNDYIKWAKDIKSALDENNAKCVIAHEPCFFKFDLTEEQFELQKRVIECCEIIGIEWLVMHPIDEDGSGDKKHMKSLADRNYAYFKKYVPLLEKHNVGMAIENVTNVFKLHFNGLKRQFGDNPYDLIELVDKLDSDKLKICIDVGHLNTMGIFHIGDTVRDIGSRLKALHIHDNDGITDQHYLPYMGTIDWADFIHALKEINYDGCFTYEATKIPDMYPDELKSSWLKLKYDIAKYIVG